MKIDLVIRYIGEVLLLNAFFMLLSAFISLFNGFDTAFYPLILSFLITAILGVFPLIYVPSGRNLTSKEGYIIVIASWIMSCMVGMLPYLIWGGEFSLMNAWFESTSGYTTTGATILNDIEALPHGLLFWRASTHWIGGVGVVLFALVILPSIGQTKMTLSSVELSSLAKNNFRYTTKKILKIIILVYVGLTFVQTVALMVAGMDWFDSICHSFSTIATGGFSTKNLSIMYYDNIFIEIVIMIFMALAGLHFGLIYATVKGKRNNLMSSEVARFYIIIMAVCAVAISASLYLNNTYQTIGQSFRYGLFQVISYCTTTGFASANDALWSPFAMLILIYLSIQCASAGSTAGGIKVDRVLLFIKAIKAKVLKLQHPNAVIRIKLGGMTQEDSTVNSAVLLISFYLLSLLVSTLLITIWGYDLLTSFTASVASLSNVGPGFGQVSNLSNMGFFPDAIKIWLSALMLFGRLELFGLIHLFLIRSWK